MLAVVPGLTTAAAIAAEAGVDLDTVLRCLGMLAGSGFIERCDRGWRLRKPLCRDLSLACNARRRGLSSYEGACDARL